MIVVSLSVDDDSFFSKKEIRELGNPVVDEVSKTASGAL